MPATTIHPLALDSLAVLLIAPLTESLTPDQQAILGAFFNVLGDLLSLNSSYLSIFQSDNVSSVDQSDKQQDQEYDLLKSSLEKLEKELNNIKQQHHEQTSHDKSL